ncbi:DUF222 domain-containing protein [Zafaria sp. Z1313]|uniref:HNH endonuclease n=1 Tax=Zafaria sp. Z1313 TaxID=3423202 RepID=UPI003D3034BB
MRIRAQHPTPPARVGPWTLRREPGPTNPARDLEDAERLVRYAEALRAAAMTALRDDAELRADPTLPDPEENPGMDTSRSVGRLASNAGHATAVDAIARIRGIGPYTASRELNHAQLLLDSLPAVHQAWQDGRLGSGQVRAIATTALKITPRTPPRPSRTAPDAEHEEHARALARENAIVDQARTELGNRLTDYALRGNTPTETEAKGRALVEQYDPESFTTRTRKATATRDVRLEPAPDGMARLSIYAPEAPLHAIYQRLDHHTRTLHATEIDNGNGNCNDAENGGTRNDEAASRTTRPGTGTGTGGTVNGPTGTDGDDCDDRDGNDGTLGEGHDGHGSSDAPRTLAQLRVDTLLDLLLNGPDGHGLDAIAPEVIITVPSTFFAGTPNGPTTDTATAGHADTDDTGTTTAGTGMTTTSPRVPDTLLRPGTELPQIIGGGPIDPATTSRWLANTTTWTRVITDPVTDEVLHWGRKRYRPTPAQRRALAYRHNRCSTAGCNSAIDRTESDHTIEWQHGGTTDLDNLAPLCKRCHRLKSLGLLTTTQHPDGTTTTTTLWSTTHTQAPEHYWNTPETPHTPTSRARQDHARTQAHHDNDDGDGENDGYGYCSFDGGHRHDDGSGYGYDGDGDGDSSLSREDFLALHDPATLEAINHDLDQAPRPDDGGLADHLDSLATEHAETLHLQDLINTFDPDDWTTPWAIPRLYQTDHTPQRPPGHTRPRPPKSRAKPIRRLTPRPPLNTTPRHDNSPTRPASTTPPPF